MWDFLIRNNRFGYLFVVALIGAGLFSASTIPRESAPEVQVPVGIVTTVLPGATATDVERLVTNEIERGLAGSLTEVKEITSVSTAGVSSVTVEFEASADIEESIDELKDRVDTLQSELPDDAEDSVVAEVDFVNQPIMSVAVAAPLNALGRTQLADEVEALLEGVPGVSSVSVSGVQEREVSVIVQQTALAKFSITMSDIVSALRGANSSLPIGQISTDGTNFNVAFEGDIESTAAVADVVVTTRGQQPIYIRDVATVIDTLAPETTASRLSVAGSPSLPAMSFDVFKQSGGDITRIADAVVSELNAAQAPGQLLRDATVEVVFNSGQDIKDDLFQLTGSGLQTVLFVMLILVVAIGWREALLAGTAIPLSFLIGFIGLSLSGNTINFLSLFSLILGIGILVDSGIVIVEGINRKMKDDPTIDKRAAAVATVREFKTPLIAGTLTTVSMFAGLFIVSGVTGQFIASIPFTLIFVLFASLFVALFVLPLFASSILRRRSSTRLERAQVAYAHQLEAWYAKRLRAVLQRSTTQRRFMWSIRLLLVVALLLPVLGFVRVIFFEQSDVPFMFVEVEMPVGTERELTDLVVRQVEEVLYDVPEIDLFVTTVGAGSQFGGGGSGEEQANIFISLKDDRERTSTDIVESLQPLMDTFTAGNVTVSQPTDGPPTGAAIVVSFIGDDLTTLANATAAAAIRLGDIPGTTNIRTTANDNGTEYVLSLDTDRAAQLGLNTQQISSLVRSAVFGTDATSITTLQDDIDIVVKVDIANESNRDPARTNEGTIDAVRQLSIPTNTGSTILLGSLVDVSLRESNTAIRHNDGERVVRLTADVLGDTNPREVQATLLETLETENVLPTGVRVDTGGGETEESNQAFIEMFIALIVGVLLMVGVLALQFNSFLHTRYVLSILPYSLIGILFGLWLTNNTLSFPSLMGFIALSGIVVNNSILLIDRMNTLRVAEPTLPMIDVVTTAASSRLRPILLTTITTVVGMIPLTYADEIWAPLAYAVMFGLLFSVVITLVLIPIVYYRKPGHV